MYQHNSRRRRHHHHQFVQIKQFYRAALNAAGRSSQEKAVSVCLSVCLSNAWIVTRQKKDLSRFFIPYKRSFSPVIWEEKGLVGATPSTWNFGPTGPRWSKIHDFEPTFACSASAITPSEKSSINTNRKSTMRFPISLRWSLHVASKPPKGAQRRRNGRFCVKSHFAWKKSAIKFLCVKTVSDQVVMHSLA